MKPLKAQALTVSSLLVLLASAFGAPDQRVERISLPLPRGPGGRVEALRFGPDGSRIVFLADLEEPGRVELHSVMADGSSAAVRLNGAMVEGGNVHSFEIAPDGTRIVYGADQDTDSVFELYSVPADGSAAPVRLNPALVASGDVSAYRITPDGARVVFRADALVDNRFLLGSVPVNGGAVTILNGPLAPGSSGVEEIFAITPDSTQVVFVADNKLFSVPVDRSASPRHINGTTGGFLTGGLVAGNTRVIYKGRPTVGYETVLFSARVDGSMAAVQIGPYWSNSFTWEMLLTPDESRAIFQYSGFGPERVYSVPSDGSGAAVILGPSPVSGAGAGEMAISSDGSRVVFRADQQVDQRYELYSVPVTGGSWVKLNDALASDEDVQPPFRISPDGTTVAFVAGTASSASVFARAIDGSSPLVVLDGSGDLTITPTSRLDIGSDGQRVCYSGPGLRTVPLDGSAAPVHLIPTPNVDAFDLSADASRIAFSAATDPVFPQAFELYASDTDGGSVALEVSPPFPDTEPIGSVTRFLALEHGALYVGPQDTTGTLGLFRAPVPAGEVVRLNGEVPVYSLTPLVLGDGGTRVVFLGGTASRRELYSALLDGSAEPLVLNAPLTSGGSVEDFLVSAAGNVVLYRADQDLDEMVELYAAWIDVAASPVKVNDPLPPSGDVFSYQCSPHGLRIVYRADHRPGVAELFSRIGDGPVIPLHAPITNGGAAGTAQLSPDGTRAFYITNPEDRWRWDLYSVPTNGSAPPTRLDDLGVADADVTSFFVAAGGTHVLFTYDHLGTRPMHLYTRRADGSTPSIRLDPGGEEWDSGVSERGVLLAPDGGHVLFHCRIASSGPWDLYSAPVDGSAPALCLSGPFASGWGVVPYIPSRGGLSFASAGTRVVYLAQENAGSIPRKRIYSVPIDRSSEPLLLHDLPSSLNPGYLRIDPVGENVAFVVEYFSGGVGINDLFSAPTDGSREPRRVNPWPSSGWFPDDFTYLVDRTTVLFRFDLERPGATELFAANPGRNVSPAQAPETIRTRQR